LVLPGVVCVTRTAVAWKNSVTFWSRQRADKTQSAHRDNPTHDQPHEHPERYQIYGGYAQSRCSISDASRGLTQIGCAVTPNILFPNYPTAAVADIGALRQAPTSDAMAPV